MSKWDDSLSYHEELRYNYLNDNIHYLSDSERKELAFLIAKKRGQHQPDVVQQVVEVEAPAPATPRRRQKQSKKKVKKEQVVNRPVYKEPDGQSEEAFFDEPEATTIVHKTKRWKRFVNILMSLIFLVVLGMGVMFVKGIWSISSGTTTIQPADQEYFDGQATRDGTNILILGSDKRITEGSTEARTDTIMVMNVGNSSGKIKLVSFMRDTLVNIEGVSSPGYYDSKINSAFTIGEQNNNQGAELMRQTLKNNFDIDIQYYVMIDFETFAMAIDTLFPSGVEMDATFSTVDGQVVTSVDVPDDLGFASGGGLYQTIAAGPQRMDGKTLLNYARFRGDDEADFGRIRRQQEVMQAVLSQVKDPTKLFTGSEALGKVYALTSTNVSFPFILANGLSGLKASQKGIERMTVPEQGDWVEEYDRYGGLGLAIDFAAYQERLNQLGLR